MFTRITTAGLTYLLPLWCSISLHLGIRSNRSVSFPGRLSGSCASDTSSVVETSVSKVRQILNATGTTASGVRSDLRLPATAGAPYFVVSDDAVCSAIRSKLDSLFTSNFQPGYPRPDSSRSIAVIRVDTVYVAGDLVGNRVSGTDGMTVLSLGYSVLARFR